MPTGKEIKPTPFSRIAPASEMSLSQLFDERLRGLQLDFNCHSIAKIESFNSAKQTCTATINYNKTFLTKNEDGTYSDQYREYPILVDVPVIILSGGNAAITFPIAAGDDCLILFNDRDIDNWFATGQSLPLNSNRLHSMSDGIALVGLRAANNPIANYDPTRVAMRNGNTQVAISSSKVKIDNGTQNLKTQLTNLCTQLNQLCTALSAMTVTGVTPGGGVSGPPSNAGTINTIGTQISTISSNIGSLLE